MHNILILGGSGLVGTAIINEMNKYDKFQVYSTYFKNPVPLHLCRLDISGRTKKLKKPLVKNKKPCYNNFCQLMPNGVTVAPVTLDHLV